MSARHGTWLSAQAVAAILDTTSAEICRLVSIGRLSGIKRRQPGRPGIGQWLINPKSIPKEQRRKAKLAAAAARGRKR
jgi:hypothetical protein